MIEQAPDRGQAIFTDLSGKLDLYQSYSRTSNFSVRVGDKTCFDHQSCTVYLAPSDLKLGRDAKLIDFDVYHELGHLMQLFTDPKAYRSLIEDCKGDESKFGFYNCILDVAVNSMIPNRSALYRQGTNYAPFVQDLYRNQLFDKHDFSERAFQQQFSYMLLLEGMSIGDDYTVSPEVRHILDTPINVFGKPTKIADFVRATFKEPVSPNEFTVTNLRFMADKFLLPIFEQLRELDRQAGREAKDWKVAPTLFSEGDIAGAIEAAIGVYEEKNKPVDQRAKGQIASQILSELDPNDKSAQDFAERFARLRLQIAERADLWRKIRSVEYSEQTEEIEGVRHGHALSIREVIRNFGSVQRGTPELPIMIDQYQTQDVEIHPRKICLHVCLDLSGSMEDSIELVKDEFVVTFGSLKAYDQTRGENDPEITSALQTYNSHADTPLNLGNNNSLPQLHQAFTKLEADGGTDSHFAISRIVADAKAVKEKEPDVIQIYLEITDGETSKPQLSRSLVNELKATGVICCGIKFTGAIRPDVIKDPSEMMKPLAPSGSFGVIFGERGREIRAKDFGKHLELLLAEVIREEV